MSDECSFDFSMSFLLISFQFLKFRPNFLRCFFEILVSFLWIYYDVPLNFLRFSIEILTSFLLNFRRCSFNISLAHHLSFLQFPFWNSVGFEMCSFCDFYGCPLTFPGFFFWVAEDFRFEFPSEEHRRKSNGKCRNTQCNTINSKGKILRASTKIIEI